MVIWIVRAFWLVYKRVFIASRYEARKWREQYSLAASKLWDLRLDLQQFFFIISKHVPFKTFTNAHALEIYVPKNKNSNKNTKQNPSCLPETEIKK